VALVGKPEVKGHVENSDVDGRIILKWKVGCGGHGLD